MTKDLDTRQCQLILSKYRKLRENNKIAEMAKHYGCSEKKIIDLMMEYEKQYNSLISRECDCGSRHNDGFHSNWCSSQKGQ